jgi:hypothetical protein
MDLNRLFHTLLDLNVGAFTSRHFEIAYHLLEAALHCAHDLGDSAALQRVCDLAFEEGAWIDENRPSHWLSSQSAQAQGGLAVFHSCARLAAMLQIRLSPETATDHY